MFAGRVKVRTKSRRTGFAVCTDGVPSSDDSGGGGEAFVAPVGEDDSAGRLTDPSLRTNKRVTASPVRRAPNRVIWVVV
jgi:hypothetical protein